MANPLVIDISTEWVWQKIATNVITGVVYRLNTLVEYYQTFRLTGEAAPTTPTLGTVPEEAVRIFEQSNQVPISSIDAIDVYVMVKYNNTIAGRDGKIRIDL